MKMCPKLQNCNSINQVVALINDELASDASAEQLAAEYAYNAADEAGYGRGPTEVEFHMDYLAEQGAIFDRGEAWHLFENMRG